LGLNVGEHDPSVSHAALNTALEATKRAAQKSGGLAMSGQMPAQLQAQSMGGGSELGLALNAVTDEASRTES